MKMTRINPRWRMLTVLGLIGSAIALAFLPAVHPVSYIRYVSPPLPDGTRYTFLYPAYLNNIDIESTNAPTLVYVGRGNPAIQKTLPKWLRSLFPVMDEQIQLSTTNLAQSYPMRPISNLSSKNSHSEYSGNHNGFIFHTIEVDDPRSGICFLFQHSTGSERWHRNDKQSAAAFDRDDAVITNSFRILPPGAAMPGP